MDISDYMMDKYSYYKHVYVYNTERDMIKNLDGKIYGVMDKHGRFICDVIEDDYIRLIDKGVINEDNIAEGDHAREVLMNKIKIVILDEEVGI